MLTEFDVVRFSEANVRQDSRYQRFRSWEVAGTSHVDQHLRDSREPLELRDNGVSSEAINLDPPAAEGCGTKPVGTRVPTTYVLASAYDKMVKWVRTARRRRPRSRIQIATFGNPSMPVRNDGPRARRHSAVANGVADPYQQRNQHRPGRVQPLGLLDSIDAATLHTLYPSHDAYVNAVNKASKANAINGYILLPDLVQDMVDALQSNVGN